MNKKMNKHTASPWIIEEQSFPPGHKITGQGRNICFFPDGGFGQGLEGEANTHLIAAAPEMLELCQAILRQMQYENPNFKIQSGLYGMEKHLLKIIAKAEGEGK